jgi:large subunit ribosomal protein L22
MIEAHAVARYARVSPRKVNQILRLIRGQRVEEALKTLNYLNKPTKRMVVKTLNSAVANAISKGGRGRIREENLWVAEARVDPGPSLKRYRAAPRGRAVRIRHRTAHIRIRVKEREG